MTENETVRLLLRNIALFAEKAAHCDELGEYTNSHAQIIRMKIDVDNLDRIYERRLRRGDHG